MAKWIRGKAGFGKLEDDTIAVHTGDLFARAKPSGQTLKLSGAGPGALCEGLAS